MEDSSCIWYFRGSRSVMEGKATSRWFCSVAFRLATMESCTATGFRCWGLPGAMTLNRSFSSSRMPSSKLPARVTTTRSPV